MSTCLRGVIVKSKSICIGGGGKGGGQLLMKVRCLAGDEVYLRLVILSLDDKNEVYVV